MRNKKPTILLILFLILLLLPIIVAIITLYFVPKEIPMHFNKYGDVDRYGSKYELMIIPCINIIFGLLFGLAWKRLFDKTYERIILIGANIGMLCFNVINCFLVWKALSYNNNKNLGCQVSLLVLGVFIGLLVIVLSTLMINRIIKIKKENGGKNERY